MSLQIAHNGLDAVAAGVALGARYAVFARIALDVRDVVFFAVFDKETKFEVDV